LEKLLEEKSDHLAFRSKVLATHQNILDSLPVGILGIDLNNTVVLYNSTWVNITGDNWYALGQNIDDSMPQDIINFIEEVKDKQKGAKKLEINGKYGRLLGAFMDYEHNQKGIILAFICEEGISC
jgi:two-component system NtrC family sensor kinase